MSMFCFQCEQTAGGRGCEKAGSMRERCDYGRVAGSAALRHKGHQPICGESPPAGHKSNEVDVFVVEALFTTVTNVSFDAARVEAMVRKAASVKKNAQTLYEHACSGAGKQPERLEGPAQWTPADTQDGLLGQAASIGIAAARAKYGEDLAGLRELLTYGLKGLRGLCGSRAQAGQRRRQGIRLHRMKRSIT